MKKKIIELTIKITNMLGFKKPSPKGDILVFTLSRSGLTWLGEIFNTIPHVRVVDEPFSPTKIPFMKKYFYPKRRYSNLSDNEYQGIIKYINKIQTNRIVPQLYCSEQRTIKTNLNVLVISKLTNIAPQLLDKFPCRPLWYVRHPIPNAVSRERNNWHKSTSFGEGGWSEIIDVYLQDESFVKRYISDVQLEKAKEIRENGTVVQKFVLNWILDNLPIFKEYEKGRFYLQFYEDLVINTEESLQNLVSHFELPKGAVTKMMNRKGKPSSSSLWSEKNTLSEIESGKSDSLVTKWLDKVDSDDYRVCYELLDLFQMDLYLKNGLPNPDYIKGRIPKN